MVDLKAIRARKNQKTPFTPDLATRLQYILQNRETDELNRLRRAMQMSIPQIADTRLVSKRDANIEIPPYCLTSKLVLEFVTELLQTKNPYLNYAKDSEEISQLALILRINPSVPEKLLETYTPATVLHYEIAKQELSVAEKRLADLESKVKSTKTDAQIMREVAETVGFKYSADRETYLANLQNKLVIAYVAQQTGLTGDSIDEIAAKLVAEPTAENLKFLGMTSKDFKLGQFYGHLKEKAVAKLQTVFDTASQNFTGEPTRPTRLEDYVGMHVRVYPQGDRTGAKRTYAEGGNTGHVPAGTTGVVARLNDGGALVVKFDDQDKKIGDKKREISDALGWCVRDYEIEPVSGGFAQTNLDLSKPETYLNKHVRVYMQNPTEDCPHGIESIVTKVCANHVHVDIFGRSYKVQLNELELKDKPVTGLKINTGDLGSEVVAAIIARDYDAILVSYKKSQNRELFAEMKKVEPRVKDLQKYVRGIENGI